MALITAVMPTTTSRKKFWPSAVQGFLAQTFKDAELLILEEVTEPSDRIELDRVRHIQVPNYGLKTGAKRNYINSLASGDIILHWDDDDWSHPERIATQLAFLKATSQQVVGYHDLLYFRESDESFWAYFFQGKKPYTTGTSMCYLRQWWESHRFPSDKSVGEDTAFWIEAAAAGVMASQGLSQMIVARAHDQNTFKIQFGYTDCFKKATRDMFPNEFLEA